MKSRAGDTEPQEVDDAASVYPDAAQSPTVLVGIPAYNEAGTIREVIEAAMPHADEVLVVDDGSVDETRQQARTAGAMVLSHDENQGYGATLGTIFEYASHCNAAHLVIIDADGQHDVTDIPDLIRTQQETGVEIVTGSRFSGGSKSEIPRYRRFGLGVINTLTNVGLRLGYSYPSVSDTQCGFRAYDRDAIESMATAPDIGNGMGASLDIIFQAARDGHEIVEVPTRIDYDVEDASTQNPVVHGLSLLGSLIVAVAQDRPGRMAAIGLTAVSVVALFILALAQFGATVLYVTVTVLAILLVVLSVTQSNGPRGPSDSTDR
ncbi:glycosyltransferase family 2 protein [Halovenus amylolytica]|uniref:glycosyltransferase family 2 protein n=1 Tax=Halovenus amylolytica TaxID=2500550 RepID=UPI003D6C06F1